MTPPVKYAYDVKVNLPSIWLSDILSNNASPISETLIVSDQFDTFDECNKKLTELLAVFCKIESKNVLKMIVIQNNPNFISTDKYDDTWDHQVYLKAFIADAQLLKKSIVKYDIFAQIRSIEESSLIQ